jgi:hypothetical protein
VIEGRPAYWDEFSVAPMAGERLHGSIPTTVLAVLRDPTGELKIHARRDLAAAM